MNKIFVTAILIFSASAAMAQQPKGNQSIDINSSYKPVLRNAVKINSQATQLPADTARKVNPYKIPAYNLFYAYAPVSLKPLALEQDTNLYLGYRKFLKAGYGNFATPYIKGGISLGDGKSSLVNITGDYIQSKGNIKNQDYSQFNAALNGSRFLKGNELYGGVEAKLSTYYLYGYDHTAFDYKKDSIRQQFQDFGFRIGFRNTSSNEPGINYDPNVAVNVFTSKDRVNETDAVIVLPAEKNINENFSAKVELKADITSYSTRNMQPADIKFSNNIVQVTPSVDYHDDNFKIHAGITPAWNNKKYELLPDLHAELKMKDLPFALQAGWEGRLVKNSYRNLVAINPYLSPVLYQLNTKETEYYGGLKLSFAKHFTLNAKAGLVHYNDLPFFINDTTGDEKSFVISNESSVNNFRVHGDISYINTDHFSLTAGVTINGYTGMKSNDRAWHTIPAEARGSLRWQAFKRVMIKSDVYFFDGSNYLAKGNKAVSLSGGTDLSAGVEVKINEHFSVWGDANNILNSKYQRWHNYEVYGANFLGGILVHF